MFSEKLGVGLRKLAEEYGVNRFIDLVKRTETSERTELLQQAKSETENSFGKDVGMLAPLYLDNHCINECLYCGMRKGNAEFERRKLTSGQLVDEIDIIGSFGYRNIELVSGQLPVRNFLPLINGARNAISGNMAVYFGTQTDEDYRELHNAGADVLFQWQETYNEGQYSTLHPASTVKGDLTKRINSLDIALGAGLENFAIGVLFGLAPWEEDVLKTIIHGKYLEEKGAKITVVGTPRFQPAQGAILQNAPFPVSDQDYIYACALYRLAFPEAHIFVSTRESEDVRREQLRMYGTLTNAECSTDVLGYKKLKLECSVQQQFSHESPTTVSVLQLVKDVGKSVNYSLPLVR